jgi:hypothetical protein
MKGDVMDRACRMHGREEECIGKLEAKRPPIGRLVCRWEVTSVRYTKVQWGLCTVTSSQAVSSVAVELVPRVFQRLCSRHQGLK